VEIMNKKSTCTVILFSLIGLMISSAFMMKQISAQEEQKYFFEINIMLDAANIDAVEIMKNGWEQIGIKTNVVSMEWSTLYSKYMFRESFPGATYDEGGYDVCLTGGVYAQDPDSLSAYHTHSRLGIGKFPNYNMMMYSNGEVDDLEDEGLVELDRDNRIEIYRRIEEIIHEELPVIYLYRDPNIAGMSANLEIGPSIRIPGSATYLYSYEFDYTDLEGGEMVFIGDQNPQVINAHQTSSTVDVNNAYLMQEPLARTDAEQFGSYEPVLAESWEISEDGKTYRFHLRQDVTWQDGEPFDANDVLYTWEMAMNPEAGFSNHGSWAKFVKDVRMIDEYTVELELNQVYAPTIYRFATDVILPEHILGDVPPSELRTHEYNYAPIGTGPFKFVEWVPDEYIQYEAYENYWRGEPKLDSIRFRVIPDKATGIAALEAGEVNFVSQQIYRTALIQNYDRLEDNPDVKVTVNPPTGVNYLILNLEHPALNNKYVRQAMAHAIDVEGIIEGPYNGLAVPFTQRYSELLDGYYNPELDFWEFSIDEAKEKMEMAGYNYELLEEPELIETSSMMIPVVLGLIVGAVVGVAIDKYALSK